MNKLIAIAGLTLAFGSGAWFGYTAVPAESSASAAGPAIPSLVNRDQGLLQGRADVDWSTLRALVRQEMDAALAAKSGSNSAAPTQTPAGKVAGNDPAPSQETLSKRRAAVERIDTMMAQGSWGNEQRFNFQEDLAALDTEQRDHALQELTTGINSGTLQVHTDGPPL